MIDYFKTIWTTSAGLVKGLAVTFRYMFEPKVTVQYPKQKATVYDDYRKLLATEKSVDAVVIAAGQRWHRAAPTPT